MTTPEAKAIGDMPTLIPRALQCKAYRCTNPMDRNQLCGAHRRGLALTAHLSDAVREFLKTSRLPIESSDSENSKKVTEAGECFARGLALLVGTQFSGEVVWSREPIHAPHGRWRVEFSWVTAANGRTVLRDDEDDNDETEDSDDGEIEEIEETEEDDDGGNDDD